MKFPDDFAADKEGWFGCLPVWMDTRDGTVVGKFWLADVLIPAMSWLQDSVNFVLLWIDPDHEPMYVFSLRPIDSRAEDEA